MEKNFVVPVIDVHKENLSRIWPGLVCAIKQSSFIALDCELSGLGDRKLINSQSIDDRYINISEVAKSRSIISIGLCCFKLEGGNNFKVHTYNLMALCTEDYVVEPSALQFLVKHGFNFQKQYSSGIPYHRGEDKKSIEKQTWDLRDFFEVLLKAKKPTVLHNGMVDLIFLYHNLYTKIPNSLSTFVADVDMLFPSGVYDTKYIAEFHLRTSASFLEYIFRYKQIKNIRRKMAKQIYLCLSHSLENLSRDVADLWDCTPPDIDERADTLICTTYSNHGFCSKGSNCKDSHDVFLAVTRQEFGKRKRKRTRESVNTIDSSLKHASQPTECDDFKGHRAGHDAFMTAFIFASFLMENMKDNTSEETLFDQVSNVRNRICLSGKEFPLLIQKSAFAKYSKEHLDKYNRIMNLDDDN